MNPNATRNDNRCYTCEPNIQLEYTYYYTRGVVLVRDIEGKVRVVSISRYRLAIHHDGWQTGTPVPVKRPEHLHLILCQLEVQHL